MSDVTFGRAEAEAMMEEYGYCKHSDCRELVLAAHDRGYADAIATHSIAVTQQEARVPDEWVNVNDRLPEEREKYYQVLTIAKKFHEKGNYEGQGIKTVAQDWVVRHYASNFTHWMEIPAIVA